MRRPAQLKFATDILRRLGEELNPSVDQGILELIKNAYDADARECTVTLHRLAGGDGSITVDDDGSGMSAEDILNGWLILGRSQKSTRRRTRLNRIPAGSKGLGRLAALRLGRDASLTTRPAEQADVELRLEIDWDDFERASVVDDVTLELQELQRSRASSGTEIRLGRLRDAVGRMDVKRLARSMILLADPFEDDPEGFKPILRAPEFRDLERLVATRYFTDADFHLKAKLDGSGFASAEVSDWRGRTLFAADHGQIARRRDGQPYACPSATFDLWAFILTREAFAPRPSTVKEVRTWLDAFGGVHLYVNGLRVSPYGNPGNDWLDMNLQRVRNPEERPGTNTSIGRVRVHDEEERLLQKTDRSGLIETEDFSELRAFARDALDWMARRRLQAAEQRRRRERTAADDRASDAREQLRATIERTSGPERQALERSFNRFEQDTQRQIKALRDEVQLYRTLSTAGITAATFAHESSGNPLKVIRLSIRTIERRARAALGDAYSDHIGAPVRRIHKAADSLAVLSRVTLGLIDHDKRRPTAVELNAVVGRVLRTYRPFLVGRDVTLRQELKGEGVRIYGTEAAVESILTNLLNNSLAAFERGGADDRCVLVETSAEDQVFVLRVLDNGPGIVDIPLEDIWLPGESRTPNGTGLGLTIVRDATADLGGSVKAVPTGRLGGAEFVVMLPVLEP